MKRALLTGGGSKWGESFCRHLLNNGIAVDLLSGSQPNLSSPNLNLISVDWHQVKSVPNVDSLHPKFNQEKYDLVFFNHNNFGAPDEWEFQNSIDPIKWQQCFWVNCQLPSLLVQKLSQNGQISGTTKVGWVLTGLINGRQPEYWKHAGYASIKYTNMAMMQGFSKYLPSIFFGLNPEFFAPEKYDEDSKNVLDVIQKLKPEDSGHCFKKDGQRWTIFT